MKNKLHKVSSADKRLILHYFYNNHDNRDGVIAKALGVAYHNVCLVLKQESDRCIASVNERIRMEELRNLSIWKQQIA